MVFPFSYGFPMVFGDFSPTCRACPPRTASAKADSTSSNKDGSKMARKLTNKDGDITPYLSDNV